MKRLILLILITFFSVPNLIYAQDLDFSKISKNTEEAKKERKERKKIQKPTGIIVSLGYGRFLKSYSAYYSDVIYSTEDANNQTFYLENGEIIYEDGSLGTSEIDIRFHYFLKNTILGFYISPIVINRTSTKFEKSISNFNESVVSTGSGVNDYAYVEDYNYFETSSESSAENDGKLSLGSIQFGVSTNISNRVTISAGSALSISKIDPVKKLEIGLMLHLSEKINIEYRYAILKVKQEVNFNEDLGGVWTWDSENLLHLSPKLHIFSIGYRISTSN